MIGKQDRFTNYFWQNINRDKFAKDVHKIILSGIFVIILSIVLTVSDIMNKKIVMILVGMMVWVLFFTHVAHIDFGYFYTVDSWK